MELEEAIKVLVRIKKNQDRCAPNVTVRNNACRNIEAIETVLKYLEKYRDLYMQSLANNLNQSLKNREMSNEQLEALNEGWKLEVEKKEKMIELIKTRIFVSSEEHEEILKIQKKHRDKSYEDCTIEYFKKKAEESE